MTLIASFEVNGAPVLIGDILVSRYGERQVLENAVVVRDGDKIDRSISVPVSTPLSRSMTAGPHFSPSGRCQKISILHPQICFAWAGSPLHARSLCEYLRARYSKDRSVDWLDLHAYFHAYPRTDIDGHIEFVLYCVNESKQGVLSNINPPFELDGISKIRAAGTGKSDFVKNVSQLTASITGDNDNTYLARIIQTQRYATEKAGHQYFYGHGLDDAWGGDFEVAVLSEGQFKKLGPTLWLFWTCEEVGPLHYRFNLSAEHIFQYFDGDYTMYFTTGKEPFLYPVEPPFRSPDRPAITPPADCDVRIVAHMIDISRLPNSREHVHADVEIFAQGETPPQVILTQRFVNGTRHDHIEFSEAHLVGLLARIPHQMRYVEFDVWGKVFKFNQKDAR